ncbi:serine/threonine-protein kinase HipA [Variovorax soli]|uniref:Serine/threonine-protein kinase HipA n=1 Tax=Variovorax soli TaxID=376815 RepID=A0ABU1N7P3_9BURK|nr:type II toxin-antitoxin system HipA family toxin [Variovorax soli]MDR6534477.1 serine/threonine-protein kinase HipA [Variovorax soli]
MSAALGIWMNGELVGHWQVERGTHILTYASEWLQSEKRRSLSLSLPITGAREIRGQVVANYFDNLLPDNDRIRERLRRRFGARDAGAFALLQAIGRDCVGAVQLMPEGTAPQGWDRVDCEALRDADIRALLQAVPSDTPLGQFADDEDLFRIAIAGAQEKTAFTRHRGRWCRPHGATPTTHIFKLPLGLVGGSRRIDLSDSIENEWLCAQLLRELGLPVANTEMAEFDGQKVLIVERFDRAWMDGKQWIARLPQEDFCQALGCPPARKYEKDGGHGMDACLKLLAGSADAQTDRAAFLLTQLAFWLLAATDGHAKNYSIFLGQGDVYAMTPLYDVISVWPYVGEGANQFRWRSAGLAMAMRSKNAHYALHTIQARHWEELAMRNGGVRVWEAMQGMVGQVEAAIEAVEGRLSNSFPQVIWRRLVAGMRKQVRVFESGVIG